MSKVRRVFGASLLLLGSSVTYTQPQPVTKGRPVVVELFTSEGCSSCPPADALLRSLNGQHTASGQPVLVLSEHVTYWNHLGWADPFSAQVFTDRQNAYGERFNLDSVYTPQIVVNGSIQVLGSDRSAVNRAIHQADVPSAVEIGKLSAVRAQSGLEVSLEVAGTPPAGSEIVAVVTDDVDASRVLRGENSGSTLTHVSVARSMSRFRNDQRHFTVPASFAAKNASEEKHHLIVFLQAKGSREILAAGSISIAAGTGPGTAR